MQDPIIKAIKLPGQRYDFILQDFCIPKFTQARQAVSDNRY